MDKLNKALGYNPIEEFDSGMLISNPRGIY